MSGEAEQPRWIKALCGKPGASASLAWGFAEGTVFFVVPDVLFTLTTLLRPRRGLLQLVTAVLGATVAGGVMYAWSVSAPEQARVAVAGVPHVGERMIAATERRWKEHGLRALFDGPLGGVPYKVYAVLAPARMPAGQFLLLSVPMRAERMLLSWVPFALVGLLVGRFGERRRRIALVLHATFWIALYAYYWSAT